MWEDSLIDREAKKFLKKAENGRKLALDTVAHLDFFYNTLLLSHESLNPFKKPKAFSALQFPVFQPKLGQDCEQLQLVPLTIMDLHRQLIYPK